MTFYDSINFKCGTYFGGRSLVNIGKDLDPEKTDGESVGMILFGGEGPTLFRQGLEKAMEDPLSSRNWHLSVIRDLCPTAKGMDVFNRGSSEL